jgi:hypothetical protein
MEVNSQEVVDTVRLQGRFGFKFEISDEYCKVDDLDPARKRWYRQFKVYGRKKMLNKFIEARKIIHNYLVH